jgi:phage-related protein
LEEEDAYEHCCTQRDSTLQSCSKFYSIRPTCKSFFWFFPTSWGKFPVSIFN